MNKRDELAQLMDVNKPDIVCICEVIPKAQRLPLSKSEFSVPGFKQGIINFDPDDTNLGSSGVRGLLVLIREDLSAVKVELTSTFKEQIFLKIKAGDSDILLGLVYRNRQGIADQVSTAELCSLVKEVVELKTAHFVMVGDFNMKEISWEDSVSLEGPNHHTQHFLACTQECFLHQHITKPTRVRQGDEPSVLDLIFSSEEGTVRNIEYHAPLGSSDHSCLSFSIQVKTVSYSSKCTFRDTNRGDYDKLREILSEVSWSALETPDVEIHWDKIASEIEQATTQSIPLKKQRGKNMYMDLKTMKMRKRKNKLHSNYLKSRSNRDWEKYTDARNKLRKQTRSTRRRFEESLIKNMKESPKVFWRYINSRLKAKAQVEDLRRGDGSFARTCQEKAEDLNDFFSSIFTTENMNDMPNIQDRSDGCLIDTVDFDVEDIKQRMKRLSPNKSPGPDRILSKVLREAAEQLCQPFQTLFQASLLNGTLPDPWKTGHISAIFKKGNRHLAANYRPISLTSIVCKLMESIVRDTLMSHFEQHGLSKHQHGFVAGRSCTSQLLTVINKWTELLDSRKAIDVVYLDFAKAFDSVPHERLLRKLSAYGIRGHLLNWIRSFLIGRRQRVLVGDAKSEWRNVVSGVPQGSVLGPVLFLIYINDLPDSINSVVKIFADDTKIFRTVGNPEEGRMLQDDIDTLATWSGAWQLPFNIEKCKVMHLGTRNLEQEYKMNGMVLQETSSEKDLGITVDNKLRFHLHTAQAVAKGFKMLGLIKRSFEKLDKDTVPLLFKAMVRPSLEYGNCVWGPMFRGDQDAVERVLRRATKLVKPLRRLPYEERLRRLGLMSMYYRRRRGDMIMTYQILTDRIKIDKKELFTAADDERTRRHRLKLKKPQVHSVARQQCFPVRVINDWNSLPDHVVSAPSVSSFKTRLDKHWSVYMYQVRP